MPERVTINIMPDQTIEIRGFKRAYDFCLDDSRNLLIPDFLGGVVHKISPRWQYIGYYTTTQPYFRESVAGEFYPGALTTPHSVATSGNILYVVEMNRNDVCALDGVSPPVRKLIQGLRKPTTITREGDGKFYISNWEGRSIVRATHDFATMDILYSPLGPWEHCVQSVCAASPELDQAMGFSKPHAVKLDLLGRLNIVDQGLRSVIRIDNSQPNAKIEVLNTYPTLKGQWVSAEYLNDAQASYFTSPTDIAFTRDGGFFVSDTMGNRIFRYDSVGNLTQVIGSIDSVKSLGRYRFDHVLVSLHNPYGIKVLGERIMIADRKNERIIGIKI